MGNTGDASATSGAQMTSRSAGGDSTDMSPRKWPERHALVELVVMMGRVAARSHAPSLFCSRRLRGQMRWRAAF